nr:uncharacterized protein LOC128699296 [Cherax quadricarinatus]
MALFRRVAHIDFENYCDNHDPNNYECTSKKKKKKKIPQGERCPATNNDELGEWHYVCNKKKKKKKFGETLNVPSNNKFPERGHLPETPMNPSTTTMSSTTMMTSMMVMVCLGRDGKPRKIKKESTGNGKKIKKKESTGKGKKIKKEESTGKGKKTKTKVPKGYEEIDVMPSMITILRHPTNISMYQQGLYSFV